MKSIEGSYPWQGSLKILWDDELPNIYEFVFYTNPIHGVSQVRQDKINGTVEDLIELARSKHGIDLGVKNG